MSRTSVLVAASYPAQQQLGDPVGVCLSASQALSAMASSVMSCNDVIHHAAQIWQSIVPLQTTW
jgi:hypothetical protein